MMMPFGLIFGKIVVRKFIISPDCLSESAAAKELMIKIIIIIKNDGYQILKNLLSDFNCIWLL